MATINFNWSATTAQRNLHGARLDFGRAVQRLSTGLRINSAADDAAGLQISEKLQNQVRGLNQATRNAQDGISLIQTAEGAMSQAHAILLRMRELAVQSANGVLTADDRTAMQSELDQDAQEIGRISASTEFNGIKILGSFTANNANEEVMKSLRTSILANAEQLVQDAYGLTADGATMQFYTDATGPAGVLAFVQGTVDPVTGKTFNQQLHVNMSAFTAYSLPNGGTPPQYLDRVVAHELTHAIMGRAMDFNSLPTWFKEGTAEYTHGADERLFADTGGQTAAGITAIVGGTWDSAWGGTSADYSAGYAAVKYLDQQLKTLATPLTMKDFMAQLTAPGATLDSVIGSTIGGNTASFVANFKTAGNGDTFIAGLNLSDTDTGSVLHDDYGEYRTATDIVPDIVRDTMDPLKHYQEDYSTANDGLGTLATLQVGANNVTPDQLALSEADLSLTSLGISALKIDTQSTAQSALDVLDGAIDSVSMKRARMSAAQNRLEYTLSNLGVGAENQASADSRIRDADVAATTAMMARAQILQQIGTAVLGQANNEPGTALSLLR